MQLSTPDNAQGAPVVPFTVPEQTALELVFRAVLPPLSNGLGPRWARVLAYSPGKTPAQGVNVTLLMYNIQTPLSEFLTVGPCRHCHAGLACISHAACAIMSRTDSSSLLRSTVAHALGHNLCLPCWDFTRV